MTILVESSPNANGNGHYLAEKIMEKYAVEGIERFRLWDIDYRGCRGCMDCKNKDTFCTQADGLNVWLPKLAAASRIVLIAPNYMGFVAGEVKQFIDRWYCMRDANKMSRFKSGSKLIFLFTQGSGKRDRGDNAQNWIKSIADSFQLKYYGITVPNCERNNTDGVRLKQDEIMMSLSFFS